MPVCVTGGTGFVGVNLVRALIEAGETVRALVRPSSSRVGLDAPGIEFVVGDVSDPDSLHRALSGCDRAYHLAGWVQITPWGMSEARRVNVQGTENVCRACLDVGVRRLVHASSIAAVASGTLDAPATEDREWDLGRLRAPYYTTKYLGERVVHDFVQRGLDAVIVNPSYVVGPFDIKPTGGRVILQTVLGRIPGYPSRGGIGFVDVREVVEGMLLAMKKGRTGERYILNGENLSYRDYAELVAGIGGVKPPGWSVHYGLALPAAMLATTIGWIHPAPFVNFNTTVVRTGFCEQYVSSGKARRDLGVRFRPIEQAVADALAWFEQHGYVRRTSAGWTVPNCSQRRGFQ